MLTPRDVFEAAALAERAPSHERVDARVLSSWRGTHLSDDESFRAYLAYHGWTESMLGSLLGSDEHVNGAPRWLNEFNRMNSYDAREWQSVGPVRYYAQALKELPFPGFYSSFLGYAADQLDVVAHSESGGAVSTGLWRESVVRDLASELLAASGRCLAQDFRDSDLAGFEYSDHLKSVAGREEFFKKYPSVARRMASIVSAHCESVGHIIRAWCKDWQQLVSERFLDARDAEITGISLHHGDPHEGGRRIAIVSVERGKLVFRPRKSPEFEFYRAIVAALGMSQFLPTLNCLQGGDYTWVEFASPALAGEISPADHFYRVGLLAGVCYSLGSVDLHMENVIATAAGPVPVDLETVLGTSVDSASGSEAGRVARGLLNDSVLGTGILPVGIHIAGSEDFEVSTLTGGATSVVGEYEEIVEAADEGISIRVAAGRTGGCLNIPPWVDSVQPEDYYGEVKKGVLRAFDCVGDRIAEVEAVLRDFEDLPVRVIVRPTNIYDLALRALCHPRHMRSDLAAEHFLLRFWSPGMEDSVRGTSLQGSEADQLLQGDIPRFTVVASRRTIQAGGKVVAALHESPMDRCRRHLAVVASPGGVGGQMRLVEDVLAPRREHGGRPLLFVPPLDSAVASRAQAGTHREATMAIMDRVLQNFANQAILGDKDVSWVGMASSDTGQSLRLSPAGLGLFDGLAGISIGLAGCRRVLGDGVAESLARRALRPVLAGLTKWNQDRIGPVGAFSGAAGMCYSLAVVGSLLRDETGDYRCAIEEFVRSLRRVPDDSGYYDVGIGWAGAAAVLSALLEGGFPVADECIRSLDFAVSHIMRGAQKLDGFSGTGWVSEGTDVPLGGFSHGAAGIGWALARAASHLNSPRVGELARQALAFDENYYVPDRGLWRDMRPENEGAQIFPVHWCHGAAGIYLARTQSRSFLSAQGLELEEGLVPPPMLIESQPIPSSDCLCHGGLGNSLCLLAAGDSEAAARYFRVVLERLRGGAFESGLGVVANAVPGLMLGYAGVLHSLGIMIDNEIPNVLGLSAPLRGLWEQR